MSIKALLAATTERPTERGYFHPLQREEGGKTISGENEKKKRCHTFEAEMRYFPLPIQCACIVHMKGEEEKEEPISVGCRKKRGFLGCKYSVEILLATGNIRYLNCSLPFPPLPDETAKAQS